MCELLEIFSECGLGSHSHDVLRCGRDSFEVKTLRRTSAWRANVREGVSGESFTSPNSGHYGYVMWSYLNSYNDLRCVQYYFGLKHSYGSTQLPILDISKYLV